mgnify:CR=1 FL=1
MGPSALVVERDSQALFGIQQGGVDHGLRAESASRLVETGYDGYAIGGLYDDGKVTPAKTRWNTGKAVEINFQFLVTDWVAPRIAIPMYVDPFTIGMTLGAPVKFRFGKIGRASCRERVSSPV